MKSGPPWAHTKLCLAENSSKNCSPQHRWHRSWTPQFHLHEIYPHITLVGTVYLILSPQAKIQEPLCTVTWGKKQNKNKPALASQNLTIRRKQRSGNRGRGETADTQGCQETRGGHFWTSSRASWQSPVQPPCLELQRETPSEEEWGCSSSPACPHQVQGTPQ